MYEWRRNLHRTHRSGSTVATILRARTEDRSRADIRL